MLELRIHIPLFPGLLTLRAKAGDRLASRDGLFGPKYGPFSGRRNSYRFGMVSDQTQQSDRLSLSVRADRISLPRWRARA
ncbi:hypothetical protein Swit_1106 [Rhizorhabdus wittichii RW1]|uniref:Uncharacterized protein n=1 Tax=Rhizorhabdus wittichii (strain DSM 6014 / CCUG 31198 / JCM 15750 / NBRC 105917 / EY 4224 / RW1) TaxID=392499 RepID=A0A9J9LBI9_RHIWR|nr:hypothetical protein Swit_1106 [Rhizorhabdus wittichii RW1]